MRSDHEVSWTIDPVSGIREEFRCLASAGAPCLLACPDEPYECTLSLDGTTCAHEPTQRVPSMSCQTLNFLNELSTIEVEEAYCGDRCQLRDGPITVSWGTDGSVWWTYA